MALKHDDSDADTTQPGIPLGLARRPQRSGEGMESIVSHLRDEASQRPGSDEAATDPGKPPP